MYAKAVDARHAVDPVEKARHAAIGLSYCGLALWAFAILDEAQGKFRDVASLFDVLGWMDFAGSSIWFAALLLAPTWLPRRLLAGDPSPSRCDFAALAARVVAFFAAFAIVVAPMMFLFASSAMEFVKAVLTVAIPMLILIYVALMTGKLASRASDALEPGHLDVGHDPRSGWRA